MGQTNENSTAKNKRMKTQALDSSNENIINTLIDDRIGRSRDVCACVTLLSCIEGSYSIGVDSKWGTGKTFFVKQAKLIIDSLNPNVPKLDCSEAIKKIYTNSTGNQADEYPPLVTAYYDAWEHDNEDEPILSLMYEIMSDNYNNYSPDNRKKWSEILASIAEVICQRDIGELVKNIKGRDPFEKIKENKDLSSMIKEFLASFLPERGNKLIVFIDELDRCSPIYAVKLLERIKHYFSCENTIFVFSVNCGELQNTIRKYYGESFDSCRYLDRFFDLRMGLPPIDTNKFIESIGYSARSNMRESVCIEIIREMSLGMREISRFLQMSKNAAFKFTDGDSSKEQQFWSRDNGISRLIALSVVVPIAIGLKMTNPSSYNDFVEGKDSSWLEKILETEYLKEWVMPLLLDSDETYSNEESKRTVTVSQKVRDMYSAIFVKSYEGIKEYQTQIGSAIFDKETKKHIMRAISFVSPYSSY